MSEYSRKSQDRSLLLSRANNFSKISRNRSIRHGAELRNQKYPVFRIVKHPWVPIVSRERAESLVCLSSRISFGDPLNDNDHKDTGIIESFFNFIAGVTSWRGGQSRMGRFCSDKSASLSEPRWTYSDPVILAARSMGFADASTCTTALVFAFLLMLNPRRGSRRDDWMGVLFDLLQVASPIRRGGVRRREEKRMGKEMETNRKREKERKRAGESLG